MGVGLRKMNYYRQCILKKDTVQQTAFIPEYYAKLNKIVKIHVREDVWDEGWTVFQVSSIRVEEDYLPDSHKEIKSHRKKTGDSMKKV